MDIHFTNVDYTTPGPVSKKLLSNVSGHVGRGEVLAVMGPSGSGKTSLLNILSGRAKPDVGSQILFNGESRNSSHMSKIGYVMQSEIFLPSLTVKQTLEFTALLRLPKQLTDEEKLNRVDVVTNELGLTKCLNTKLGDAAAWLFGVSGGEKKRVNIANELITNPDLLILDEPTSGLDSAYALDVLKRLKQVAHVQNKTLILTIHQPTSEHFSFFDKILVMLGGEVVLFQDLKNSHINVDDIHKFLIVMHERLIHEEKSTADNDFETNNIESCITDDNEIYKTFNFIKKDDVNIDRLCPRGSLLKQQKTTLSDTDSIIIDPITMTDFMSADNYIPVKSGIRKNSDGIEISIPYQINRPDWLYLTRVLTRRVFILSKNKLTSTILFQTIFISIFCGGIYFDSFNIDDRNSSSFVSSEEIVDAVGVLSFGLVYFLFLPMFASLNAFPPERSVIVRERQSKAYGISSYFMAKCIGQIPIIFLQLILFTIFFYPMVGLPLNKLWAWVFMTMCISLYGDALGLFVSAITMDVSRGNIYCSIYVICSFLVGGFWRRIPNLPNSFFQGLSELSPMKHSLNGLLSVYVESVDNVSFFGDFTSGRDIIEDRFGLYLSFFGWSILILLVAQFILRILIYLVLRYSRHMKPVR